MSPWTTPHELFHYLCGGQDKDLTAQIPLAMRARHGAQAQVHPYAAVLYLLC